MNGDTGDRCTEINGIDMRWKSVWDGAYYSMPIFPVLQLHNLQTLYPGGPISDT